MTKSIIIRFLGYIFQKFGGTDNNVTKEVALTVADVDNFYYSQESHGIDSLKNGIVRTIQPLLDKGGFTYDPSLWKWSVTTGFNNIKLWVDLIFPDDNNVGESKLMNDIRKTGILNEYDHTVIKKYS